MAAESQGVDLTVRTLGGQEIHLGFTLLDDKVLTVKWQLADAMKAPQFTLRLLHEGVMLEDSASLRASGLPAADSAELTVVRVPAKESDWKRLLETFKEAAEGGFTEEAAKLLDQGAGHDGDGNLILCKGSNVLHLAVRARLVELAMYLASREGIDLERRNENGRTALHQAAIKELPEVVDALLKAGVDVHIRDDQNKTALDYAIAMNRHGVSLLLLEAGGDASSHVPEGYKEWLQRGAPHEEDPWPKLPGRRACLVQ